MRTANTELTGYLRCGGSLEVLAVITVSVEFKMSLKYVSAGNKVWGRATLTVEVDILFFSTSVDLTVERQFAGGGSGGHAALCSPAAPCTRWGRRRYPLRTKWTPPTGRFTAKLSLKREIFMAQKQTIIWTALPNGTPTGN